MASKVRASDGQPCRLRQLCQLIDLQRLKSPEVRLIELEPGSAERLRRPPARDPLGLEAHIGADIRLMLFAPTAPAEPGFECRHGESPLSINPVPWYPPGVTKA